MEDIQQDIDFSVTLEQFTQFLTIVGRSSKCPVCPHDGEWLFYIDKSSSSGLDSPMAITDMVTRYAKSPSDTYHVFTMECPNCGNLAFTNANMVIRKLKGNEDG